MEENYRALADAVIMQAVKDYRSAYRRRGRFPDDSKAEKDIRMITRFFCSRYFQVLTDLDGPMLLKKTAEMEGVG